MRMSKGVRRARAMRRNPTDGEARLWEHLRGRRLGAKFRRQHPLFCYTVDFCCEEARLIVEADGGQHDEQGDAERTRLLEAAGYTVMRFWNADILSNTEGVLQEIAAALRRARG